jgi:hypothetical protein
VSDIDQRLLPPGPDDENEPVETSVPPVPPVVEAVTGRVPPPPPATRARPDLIDRREALYRDCRGYRLRLDPPDLARLRELPGSRGKSDEELGEAFFDGQAERLAASLVDDVPAPSEIRVVVDPYSRQAFLALENRIRGVLSF